MQKKTIIKNMPSEEVVRKYFEYLLSIGIPERVKAEERKEEEKQKTSWLSSLALPEEEMLH